MVIGLSHIQKPFNLAYSPRRARLCVLRGESGGRLSAICAGRYEALSKPPSLLSPSISGTWCPSHLKQGKRI